MAQKRSGGSIDSYRQRKKMTVGAVEARAIIAKSGHIERIDRIISTAVDGRKSALREIGRHRHSLAEAPNDRRAEVESEARRAPDARHGDIAA